MKRFDEITRLFSDFCSLVGLFTMAYALIWAVCHVIDYHLSFIFTTYCAIALAVVAWTTLKMFIHETRLQFKQRKNLRHERLLTYHDEY